MKKENIFALLAQAGFALAAALLISIGLASCSKDKNKTEEGVVYMTTEKEMNDFLNLNIDENDGPIFVEGAEVEASAKDEGWLKSRYKVSAKKLIVRGKFTRLDCSTCSLNYLDVSKKKDLKELRCLDNGLQKLDVSNNPKLTHLECQSTKITGENLKLPNVKGIGEGVLRFKVSGDNDQKLSVKQVENIKNLGWKVFFYKDGSWQEYNGED